jgi:hypothetical protein
MMKKPLEAVPLVPIWTPRERALTSTEVLRALRSAPEDGFTIVQLINAVGHNPEPVKNILGELRRRGKVRKSGTTSATRYHPTG